METNKLPSTLKAVSICAFLLLVLTFTQCRGPEGPMGNDGYDGINYTRSVIYDIAPSEWAGDLNGYDAVIDVPEITEDIYYTGAVLVYKLVEINPKSFNMLPYTYVDDGLAVYMDFDAYVGSIDLIYKEVFEGLNDTPAPADVMSFKVLIIEGVPLATLKGMVDVSDYQAVVKMFKPDTSTKTVY